MAGSLDFLSPSVLVSAVGITIFGRIKLDYIFKLQAKCLELSKDSENGHFNVKLALRRPEDACVFHGSCNTVNLL